MDAHRPALVELRAAGGKTQKTTVRFPLWEGRESLRITKSDISASYTQVKLLTPTDSETLFTVKAFSCRVDNGEVVAGAPSYHQVKWSPLFNLTGKIHQ